MLRVRKFVACFNLSSSHHSLSRSEIKWLETTTAKCTVSLWQRDLWSEVHNANHWPTSCRDPTSLVASKSITVPCPMRLDHWQLLVEYLVDLFFSLLHLSLWYYASGLPYTSSHSNTWAKHHRASTGLGWETAWELLVLLALLWILMLVKWQWTMLNLGV